MRYFSRKWFRNNEHKLTDEISIDDLLVEIQILKIQINILKSFIFRKKLI